MCSLMSIFRGSTSFDAEIIVKPVFRRFSAWEFSGRQNISRVLETLVFPLIPPLSLLSNSFKTNPEYLDKYGKAYLDEFSMLYERL